MAAAKRSGTAVGSEPAKRIAENQNWRTPGCPRPNPAPLRLANSRAEKNATRSGAALRSTEFVNE